MQTLIPKLAYKYLPVSIYGGTTTISGSQTVAQILQNEFAISDFSTWKGVTIENLGNDNIIVNNAVILTPKGCLKLSASSPSEVTITSQQPTVISTLLEFGVEPVNAYAITITNSESDPTPTPFQQLLTLNLQGIISSPSQLLNLKFYQDINHNTPLYAWIMSYTSDLSTVYIWVSIPSGIPASSSITIYMQVTNTNQYPYTGISPYYNSQYDNGQNVFLAYFNGYTPLSDFYTPNKLTTTTVNGVQAILINGGCCNLGFVYTAKPIPYQPLMVLSYAIDLGNQPGGLTADNGIAGLTNGTDTSSLDAISVNMGCNSTFFSMDYFENGSEYRCNNSQGAPVSELVYGQLQFNENSWSGSISPTFGSGGYSGSLDFNPLSGSSQLYLGVIGGVNSGAQWQTAYIWMFASAYPPNGVMPSNSQPQKVTVYIA
ncbi:hypothetical protein [Sulfuracidifex metallicus]|uniref:hypothetical protein n=1 Tax=Sulfuracidifex metallicus TaxID=47303 RepID=UPI002273D49D|nr:hypothetical protein [Sulfuracidifex metallicus]MCY0851065.1 hypothetical protein [Sulfuracidifex metallicus]